MLCYAVCYNLWVLSYGGVTLCVMGCCVRWVLCSAMKCCVTENCVTLCVTDVLCYLGGM